MKTGFSKKGTHNEEGWEPGYSFIMAMLKLVNRKLFVESIKGIGTKSGNRTFSNQIAL